MPIWRRKMTMTMMQCTREDVEEEHASWRQRKRSIISVALCLLGSEMNGVEVRKR
jgi:hypothetical protein